MEPNRTADISKLGCASVLNPLLGVWSSLKHCTSFLICPCVGEPRGILGKESSKPVPVKKPLHRSVSFTEPEHQPKVEKQIGRCKSAATLETMAGAGSEPENLSGKCLTMLLPSF